MKKKLKTGRVNINRIKENLTEIRKENEVLKVENKIAVSIILNENNPGGYNPDLQNDEKVSKIIEAMQQLIDYNNDDNSSTNKYSESIEEDSYRPQIGVTHDCNINKIKNEIYDMIRGGQKENDSAASNSIISSGIKKMATKYNNQRFRPEYEHNQINLNKNCLDSPGADQRFLENRRSSVKSIGKLSAGKGRFEHLEDLNEEEEDEIFENRHINHMYQESPPEKDINFRNYQ